MFSFVCICIYTSMTADNTRSGCWPRRTWRGGACCRCCPPQAAGFEHFFQGIEEITKQYEWCLVFCEPYDRHHHPHRSSETNLTIIKITTMLIIKSTTCPLRASPVCSLNCSIRLFCGAACCWRNALSNLKMSFAHCRLFPQSIELFLL